MTHVLPQRVVMEMAAEGAPFVGVLYGGFMLTPQGPAVLEFNCRFGDPEAQALVSPILHHLL
jgi:phosphoribosylamine-glycine ligase